MGFELFIQCFQHGEPANIPRQSLRTAFGAHLTETATNRWQLHYDKANWCDIYLTVKGPDPNTVQGFCVDRPCADERLWDALASILTLGNVVLYFPGGQAPIVGSSGVKEHLPPDMVRALGDPVILTSGKEIQTCVRET